MMSKRYAGSGMGERSFVLVPMRTFAAGCLIQAVEDCPKPAFYRRVRNLPSSQRVLMAPSARLGCAQIQMLPGFFDILPSFTNGLRNAWAARWRFNCQSATPSSPKKGLPGQAPVMPSSGLEREQRNLRGIENGALEPEIEPVIAAPVMDHAGNLPQILVVVVDRDQQLGMVL